MQNMGRLCGFTWLQPGGKLIEVNSQHAAVEMGPNAYNGPTVKYEVNKTYHVTINYDDDQKTTQHEGQRLANRTGRSGVII